jgi:hypothetical protein
MQVGRLVKELPPKAKVVGEAAYWGSIAEGVKIPLPNDRAAPVDLTETRKHDLRDAEAARLA